MHVCRSWRCCLQWAVMERSVSLWRSTPWAATRWNRLKKKSYPPLRPSLGSRTPLLSGIFASVSEEHPVNKIWICNRQSPSLTILHFPLFFAQNWRKTDASFHSRKSTPVLRLSVRWPCSTRSSIIRWGMGVCVMNQTTEISGRQEFITLPPSHFLIETFYHKVWWKMMVVWGRIRACSVRVTDAHCTSEVHLNVNVTRCLHYHNGNKSPAW